MIKESRQGSITRKCKHHAAVACKAEEATVPDTENDDAYQTEGAVLAENVNEYLENRLTIILGRIYRSSKILN